MNKLLTLVVIFSKDNKKILLGMKKRGFGVGRWNGFGGKLEMGETIEDAAKREVSEEIEIKLKNIEKCGIITFYEAEDNPLEVHIFKSNNFINIPVETEEMKPEWFDVDKIPYGKMWPDDKYWLPMLISGKKFKGEFWFKDKDNTDKITNYNLREVSAI